MFKPTKGECSKMRSTKGHELTLNVVSVVLCDFVDRTSSQVNYANSRAVLCFSPW